MRTKVLLCAAVMAASLATSMAQNVYSLNVVGYYNVTATGGGYTLMANQLNTGGNTINQVLPGAPDGALVLTFVNNDYKADISIGGAWFDNVTTDPSTTTLPPGKGFFYNNPGATASVTFVGEVPQGPALSVPLPPNYGLVGTYTPQSLTLTAANSFPVADGMLYLKFVNNDYFTAINIGGDWFDNVTTAPVTVQPAVGEGYFINNPGASTTWTRSFTVQ